MFGRKKQLVRMTEIDRNNYIGAIILGLNDAIVELTGALAGFTMALSNNRLILLAGLTTGVAATLSMAASEFLAKEADSSKSNSYKAAFFTGLAYLVTVAILLCPYYTFKNPYASLAVCLCLAASVIVIFTYAVAKIRKTSFKHDCIHMLIISFTVAAIAFGISWAAKLCWGIEA